MCHRLRTTYDVSGGTACTDNYLGDAGATAVAAIMNSTATFLNLSGECSWRVPLPSWFLVWCHASLSILSSCVPTMCPCMMVFRSRRGAHTGTQIGNAGAAAIAVALENNVTLKELWMNRAWRAAVA